MEEGTFLNALEAHTGLLPKWSQTPHDCSSFNSSTSKNVTRTCQELVKLLSTQLKKGVGVTWEERPQKDQDQSFVHSFYFEWPYLVLLPSGSTWIVHGRRHWKKKRITNVVRYDMMALSKCPRLHWMLVRMTKFSHRPCFPVWLVLKSGFLGSRMYSFSRNLQESPVLCPFKYAEPSASLVHRPWKRPSFYTDSIDRLGAVACPGNHKACTDLRGEWHLDSLLRSGCVPDTIIELGWMCLVYNPTKFEILFKSPILSPVFRNKDHLNL